MTPKPAIPKITGDWKLLYRPEKTGCYVNDHSLIRALDGSWHLFGITRDDPAILPDKERWFTHGKGRQLISADGFQEIGIVCDNGVRAWAPSVVTDGKRYYMYYGPAPTRFATSDELSHWMENPIQLQGCPLDAAHRDHMVFKLDEKTWLMYATGIKDGCAVISVFESNDLVTWRFLKYALRNSARSPIHAPWGTTESPFVIKRDGWFYLFLTHTNCEKGNYHNTLVFCSTDPLEFGEFSGDSAADPILARLHAHAPEIVQDDDGNWYITTCGWRNFNTPIEGGVAIARLEWS